MDDETDEIEVSVELNDVLDEVDDEIDDLGLDMSFVQERIVEYDDYDVHDNEQYEKHLFALQIDDEGVDIEKTLMYDVFDEIDLLQIFLELT